MAEYKECETLIKFIKNTVPCIDRMTAIDCVLMSIQQAPTADVVEVVRCKDCKYFDQYSCLYSDDPSGFGKCEKIRMDIDLTIDDFCSYGERRKENG